MAMRFSGYVDQDPARASAILLALGSLIDLVCGAGGALITAAPHFARYLGVDIGLRWLVICQKRLAEATLAARLFYADVEALPFAEQMFSQVIAENPVDHVRSRARALWIARARWCRLAAASW